jgi:hypothetical protein
VLEAPSAANTTPANKKKQSKEKIQNKTRPPAKNMISNSPPRPDKYKYKDFPL